ncbi:MAG: RHS repeat-associated core domain-containing protein, partial [bacterium]|nr:RHS repeat-associated core domain-containing protein [bacterium]
EPDMALAGSAFLVDDGVISWTLKDDTYTVRSEVPLPTGEHTLRIDGGTPFDLAGKGLEEPFETAVSVEEGTDNTELYSRPDPRSVALNSLVNRFTFHGRPFDSETGLYYFRNRYFDPELGRFITADPLGYVDGPSMYQFAGYSPFSFSDPLGLDRRSSALCMAGKKEFCEKRKSGTRRGFSEGEYDPKSGSRFLLSKRIWALREEIALSKLKVALLEYLRPWEPGSEAEREQLGIVLYGLGFRQNDVTALMNRVLGPSGGSSHPIVQLHSYIAADTAGFVEVSVAGLDLALALCGAIEGLSSISRQLGIAYRGLILETDDIALFARRGALRALKGGEVAFDPIRLSRVRTNLERQGVTFITGEEGGRLARALGGEALYIPEAGRPGIIAFGPNPSRTAVVEELIHFGQHRRLAFGDVTSQIPRLEVQAQLRLLRTGQVLGWSEYELSRIGEALVFWMGQ